MKKKQSELKKIIESVIWSSFVTACIFGLLTLGIYYDVI